MSDCKHGEPVVDSGQLKSAVITCNHAHWQLYLYTAGLHGPAASCAATFLCGNQQTQAEHRNDGLHQGWVTSSWRVQINAFFSLCRFLAGRFAVVPLIPQALLVRDVWISPSLACYLGCVCPSPPAGKLTAFLLWNLTLMLSPGWFIKSQSCLTDKQQSGKTNGGVTQQEMWLRLGLMGFKVHPSHTVERLWGWQCACHIVSEKLPASHYIQTFLPSACSDASELQRISLALQ